MEKLFKKNKNGLKLFSKVGGGILGGVAGLGLLGVAGVAGHKAYRDYKEMIEDDRQARNYRRTGKI